MKKIQLTQGYHTIVDDADYNKFSKFKWHVVFRGKKGYAERTKRYGIRKNNKKKHIKMHRIILKAKSFQQIDHINGNSLDNRKNNLRICTNIENSRNHKGQPLLRKYSQFKGVKKNANCKTWSARITVVGKEIYLGSFKTEKFAAIAYNKAANKYFKNFAYLNKVKK
jgi:hypothetical protein